MRCSNCGDRNRRDATFCLGCGEPFDADGFDYAALSVDSSAERSVQRNHDAERSVERADLRAWLHPRRNPGLWLAVLLVMGFFAYDLASQGQQQDAGSYRRAERLVAAKDWQAAADTLLPLRDKQYSNAAHLYLTATDVIAAVERDYAEGERLRQSGATPWLAAYHYRRAAEQWPNYADTGAHLTALREQSKPLLYRVPGGAQAGFYLAHPDGGVIAKLPESNGSTRLHEIAANLILYSNSLNGVNDFYLYSVSDDKASHFMLGSTGDEEVAAAIFADGQAVAAVVGGFGGAPRSDNGLRRLYCFDPASGWLQSVGGVQLAARPGYDHDRLFYAAGQQRGGNNGTMLMSYAPDGRTARFRALRWVRDSVNRLLAADSGRQVVFVGYRNSRPALLAIGGDGGDVRTLYTPPQIGATEASSDVIEPTISPDGKMILFRLSLTDTPVTMLHDLTNGETSSTGIIASPPTADRRLAVRLSFSPDGQQIVAVRPLDSGSWGDRQATSEVYRYDRNGNLLETSGSVGEHYLRAGFLADGSRYHIVYHDGLYYFRTDATAADLLPLVRDSSWHRHAPFRLDDDTLLLAGSGNEGVGVYAVKSDGTPLQRLIADATAAWPLDQSWQR